MGWMHEVSSEVAEGSINGGRDLGIGDVFLSSEFVRNAAPLFAESGLRCPDRGRNSRLSSATPPSEPDLRISRIRLSGCWFYLCKD